MTPLTALVIAATFLGGLRASEAAVSKAELAGVEAVLPSDRLLPLSLPLQGEKQTRPLQEWLGATPSIWILADYTCESLCGPVVSIVAGALAHSGLAPGTDFRLIVVGLDPKDSAADALAMKQVQIGERSDLADHSYFLRGSAGDVGKLADAFGFRFRYDRERDQFAHPAAAFVVSPDGHVMHALSGLLLDATTLRLALVDAGQGKIGWFADHVSLICYGFDPVSGSYNLAVGRLLAGTALVSILALGALITVLIGRERWARES